ncbi:MAG: twin-arginine translocase TatA/TatE family subunit [Bdellovibrionales bacterium]|nr:twin-arginine translocase TatA/TatE family subunit [Bdellovibrionales bacterium]
MGGMSIWHLLILLTIVLLFFGPSRLGDLGKSLGQAVRGFKKGLNEDPEIDVTQTSALAQRENMKREALKQNVGENQMGASSSGEDQINHEKVENKQKT